MAVYDLYFKRQRKARGETDDVYQYESLPEPLRVQIVHIWREVMGSGDDYNPSGQIRKLYEFLVGALRKELGVFKLPHAGRHDDIFAEWFNQFLLEEDMDIQLSMVELSSKMIELYCARKQYRELDNFQDVCNGAIEEINERFKENGVGFQYVDREIMRVDSQLLHAEVVKPALALLRGSEFAGAQAEFLKAHEEYRHGDTKGALTECLNSLESVMKVICKKRGWEYEKKANSKTLIGVMFDKKLIPDYWQSHFAGLRATLEGGVPTARNKDSGHGQGSEIKTVPVHLAGYVLHQTAAAIVFLVEAERALG